MHPSKLIPTQRAALADAANGPLMRCAGGYHGASLHTVRATNALRRADFLRPADAFAAEPLTRKDLVEVISEEGLSGLDTALNNLFHEGRIVRMDDTRPYKYTLAPGTAQVARRRAMTDSAPGPFAPHGMLLRLDDLKQLARPPKAAAEAAASTKADSANNAEQAPGSEPPPKRRGGTSEKPKAKPAKSTVLLVEREKDAKALRDKLKLPVVATGNPDHKVPMLALDASKLDNCRRLSTQLRVLSRTLEEWPEADVPAELVSMIERCTREAA